MTRPRLASVPDDDLARLAREVRCEYEAADRAFESAVQHAARCGTLLIEAKAKLRHGQWLPWLREVGVPSQTASTYMRLAAKFPDQGNLPATIADALEAIHASEVDDRIRASQPDRSRAAALNEELDRWRDWAEAVGMGDVDERVRELVRLVNFAPPDPLTKLSPDDRSHVEANLSAAAHALRLVAKEFDRLAGVKPPPGRPPCYCGYT